jgi:hypothetical protein
MSVLTGSLNPAHVSNPPTSGTLLLPHYLLLCHSQGLDVLPLVGPPAPEPYALIRRISFKSVVVMEERGVLIAIAGRRDGVRVYALDELRRVIQWRLDIETRKEKEKSRKEESKKLSGNVDQVFGVNVLDPAVKVHAKQLSQVSLANGVRAQPRAPIVATIPPSAVVNGVTRDAPPAYTAGSQPPAPMVRRVTPPTQQHSPRSRTVLPVPEPRARSDSVVLAPGSSQRPLVARPLTHDEDKDEKDDQKGDWAEADHSSDDEALSLAAAGASGSAALDERTSAMSSAGASGVPGSSPRPALRDIRSTSVAVLSSRAQVGSGLGLEFRHPGNQPSADAEDEAMPEEDEVPSGRHGDISLAQILLESRIPDLPPPGTRLQQQPILLTSTSAVQLSNSTIIGRDSDERPPISDSNTGSRNNRRRWSLLGSSPTSSAPRTPTEERVNGLLQPSRGHTTPNPVRSILRRSSSFRSTGGRSDSGPAAMTISPSTIITPPPLPSPRLSLGQASQPQRATANHPPISSSRFFPRIFSLGSRRRSEEDLRRKISGTPPLKETTKNAANQISAPPPPQPKLDYVKLPGTKGSILIKAVETQRKRCVKL